MTKYTIFFLKSLIFVVFLAITDLMIGFCADSLHAFCFKKNPKCEKSTYMIKKCSDDIFIVGASDAFHHYIPKMIEDSTGFSTYNFGAGGCVFLYQNCEIHLALKRHSPRIIIWQLGTSNLTTLFDDTFEYQSIINLYPYYDDDYCREVINNRTYFQSLLMLSRMYQHNSKITGYFINLLIEDTGEKGYSPLATTGYKYPEISNETDTCPINPLKVDRLVKTINNCKENGVNLIFAIAPTYNTEVIYNTPQYKKLIEIANEMNIPIIESRKYREHFQDSTLFHDVSHMNDNGARLWMSYFIPELKQIMKERGIQK